MEQPSLPRIQGQRRPDNRASQNHDMGFMDVPEQGAAGCLSRVTARSSALLLVTH